MRNFKNILFKGFIGVIAIGLLLVSCKKENDVLPPMRMFMPGGFDITSYTSSVFLTWDPSLYSASTDTGITYTVQVSEDSTFQSEPFLTVTTDTTGVRFTDDTLAVRQRYYARIKANQSGDRPESGWVLSPPFKIQGIQIILPKETQVQATRVQLHWTVTTGVNKIILTADSLHGNDTSHVAISANDASSGTIEINDLLPATTYHVELYIGKVSVGYTDFTTKKAITGNIIDLSGITNRPEILADTLHEIPSGSVVYLRRGSTYFMTEGFRLDSSVVIMSKPGFEDRAKIVFQGGAAFDFEEGSQVDSVIFNELILTGDYGSNYVLNISKESTIGKIVFDECKLRTFRGVFRIKSSGIAVTDIIYNDCIIDSVNSYGVMNLDQSSAIVHNIRVNNTTIINANKMFVGKAGVDSLLVDNCTFYNAPSDDGRYFGDYGSNVVSYVRIHSCVFGKTNSTKGIKAGDGTQIFVSGSYKTADYESEGYDITGLTLYNQPSDKIFKDPENGDLTIIDSNFPLVGDPRWFP